MSWPQQNWQNAPTASSTTNTNTNQFMPGYSGGNTESQYAQYQNWQQWQTYHQQYAQWHAQYGELYQKEMQSQYGTTGAQAPPLPAPTAVGVALTAPLPPISLPAGFGAVPPPPPPNDKEPIPPPPDSAPPPPAEPTVGEKLSIPFIGPIFPTDLNSDAKKPNQPDNADNNEGNSNLNKSNNNFGFNNTSFNSMPPNFNQNNMNEQNQRFDWERSGNNNFNNNQRNNNRFDSNRESGRDSFGRNDLQNNRDNWNNQNQRDSWNNQNQRDNWSNHNQRDNWNNQNQRDNWNNQRGDNQRENQNNLRDNWGGQNKRDSWNTANQRGGDNPRDLENIDQPDEDNSNQRDNQNYRGGDNWKNQNQRGDNLNNQNQRGDNFNNQNQRGSGDNWNNRNQRGDRDFNRNNQNQRGNDNFRENWNQNSRNNRNNRFSDSGFGGNQSPGGQDFSNEDSFTQNSRDKPSRYSDTGFGNQSAMLPVDAKSNRYSDAGFGGGNQGTMLPVCDKPNRYSDAGLGGNQGSMLPMVDKPNRFSDSGFGGLQNQPQPNQQSPFIEKSSRTSDYESKPMDDCQTSIKEEPQKAIAAKSDPATGLELTSEEKAFDEQFQTWENEFVKWKQENANHPDRKAYREYEMKFEEFRRKLLDRRESMRKRRLEELNIGRRSLDGPLENLDQTLNSQNALAAVPGHAKSLVAPAQQIAQQPVQQEAQNSLSQIAQKPVLPATQQQVEQAAQQQALPAAQQSGQPTAPQVLQQASQQPVSQPPAQQPPKSTPAKIPSLFDVKIDENLVEKSKWTSGSGIPGLDLIPASSVSRDLENLDDEVADVINLDDENSPKKVDREAEKLKIMPPVKKLDLPPAVEIKKDEPNSLSQGINNILGDPNLVSLLNLVQPALSQINPQAINQLNPLLSVLGALTKQQQQQQLSSPQLQNTYYLPPQHQQTSHPPSNIFNQAVSHPDPVTKSRGLSREASASRMSCDRSIASEDDKNIDKSGNAGIVFESDDFAARLRELKAGKFNVNDTLSNSEIKEIMDPKVNLEKKNQQEEDDNSFEKRLQDLKAGRLGNLLGDRDTSAERKPNISNEETSRNPPNENNQRYARRSRFSNITDEPQRLLPQQFETNPVQGTFDEKCDEPLKTNNRSSAGQDFNNASAASKDSEEMFKPTQVIDYQNKSMGLAAGQNRWDGVDILMPAKVVDYGHKKPANAISNAESFDNNFMKPMKTIDYGHTSTAIGQRRQGSDDYLNQYNKRSRFQEGNYRDNQDNNWKNRDNQDSSWRNRDNRNDNRDYQDNRNSGNFMDTSLGYSNKWVPNNFQQQQPQPSSNQQHGSGGLIDNSFDDQIKRAKLLKTQRSGRDNRDDSGTHLSDNSNSGKLPEDLEAVSDEENQSNVNNENMLDDADDISADEFDDNNYDDELIEEDAVAAGPLLPQQPLPQRQPVVKPLVTAKPVSPPKKIVLGANTISMDDILLSPGRKVRPPRILIIMRGPPGCGKTFLSKLIKDKEVEMGGSAPRIMSIDDYFMTEVDSVEKCPKTGRDIKMKKMEYEYEQSMEETYYNYLMKSFKKNITDGLFNFIIVDCTNATEKSYSDFYNFGKSNGFTPYICQLEIDLQTCLNRNTHKRLEEDIEKMVKNWIPTPEHYLKVDSRSLLQSIQISDVEMEDVISDEEFLADVDKNKVEVDEDEGNEFGMFKSKWETGPSTEENLARLDGTSKPLRQATIEDYLQTDDDVAWEPTSSKSGKKRVRWADIEEKRAQEKMRAIGFVVGQTDWNRMMDPTGGSGALTQTKYIERFKKK